jgi:hypothetical protein
MPPIWECLRALYGDSQALYASHGTVLHNLLVQVGVPYIITS